MFDKCVQWINVTASEYTIGRILTKKNLYHIHTIHADDATENEFTSF